MSQRIVIRTIADLEAQPMDDGIYRLNRADLEGAQLQGVVLISSDFHYAKMKDVNLDGASLDGAEFKRAIMNDAILTNLVSENGGMADFSYAKLKGANFTGSDLEGAVFLGADLTDAKFKEGTNLRGADFRDSILANTDFRGSNFLDEGDSITFENLDGAIFDNDDEDDFEVDYNDDDTPVVPLPPRPVPEPIALPMENPNMFLDDRVVKDVVNQCKYEDSSVLDFLPFKEYQTFLLSDGHCYSVFDLLAIKKQNITKSFYTRAPFTIEDYKIIGNIESYIEHIKRKERKQQMKDYVMVKVGEPYTHMRKFVFPKLKRQSKKREKASKPKSASPRKTKRRAPSSSKSSSSGKRNSSSKNSKSSSRKTKSV
jgi:hypothetical protein